MICIDAGHGGSDPGKVGNSNILEKDINLSLALKLQKLLEKKNYKVYMTRNGDYNLADSKENEKRSDLSNRKQLIFENDPMAVISFIRIVIQAVMSMELRFSIRKGLRNQSS